MAKGTARSHLNCNNQNHMKSIQNNFIIILPQHWLHKNIEPSEGEEMHAAPARHTNVIFKIKEGLRTAAPARQYKNPVNKNTAG